MAPTHTPTDGELERLSSALNIFQIATRAVAAAGPFSIEQAVIVLCEAESRLNRAAIDCGMSIDEPDLEGWSAKAVCDFLRAA